jgi:hypothetical protein
MEHLLINSNNYKNCTTSRLHIDTGSICDRKPVHFSKQKRLVQVYTNARVVIYGHGNGEYDYEGIKRFSIGDGILSIDNLTIVLPKKSILTTFERVMLSLGIPLGLDDGKIQFDLYKFNFKELYHVLTTLALKDLGILASHFALTKQLAYGEHLFEVMLLSLTTSGSIASKNKHIKWLNEEDTLQLKAKLFKTTHYIPNYKSMSYSLNDLGLKIIEQMHLLLLSIEFKVTDTVPIPLDFILTMDTLKNIKLTDQLLLLSDCVGYDNGFIIRPNIKDEQFSRVYSCFTSISSNTRLALGYYGYDLNSACATIAMHHVKDRSKYPAHEELVQDKVAFRQKIADESGQNIEWAKKQINKADHNSIIPKSLKKYPTLYTYALEAQKIQQEVVDNAEKEVRDKAELFAKDNLIFLGINDDGSKNFEADGKKLSSRFFFTWTQYERKIREAMKRRFIEPEACHDVHDAIYSKEDVPISDIELVVQKFTGYQVSISKE